MPATPESVLRAWFDGVWNRADESTIDRLMHADTLIHGLPTPDGRPIRGPHNFRPFYQQFRAAFPDVAIEILHVITQGSLAVAHLRVTGTQKGTLDPCPPTGRKVTFEGFAMCEVDGDRVNAAWNCFDFLGMYRQLGAEISPPPIQRAAGA
jgi:predicted ester cyclase